MTDILERLRTAASLAQALPACREAADEIERLREQLKAYTVTSQHNQTEAT